MAEYAPQAIRQVYDGIKAASKALSGIVGDAAHTYGYHRGANYLPASDYSRQLWLDKNCDGEAASALDIRLSTADMELLTGRLLAAAKAHSPLLRGLREFGGTTNGTLTHSYDLADPNNPNDDHEGFGEWDDSHLWHLHLSFYRQYANRWDILSDIVKVLNGEAGLEAPATQAPAPVLKVGVWYLGGSDTLGEVTGPNNQHSGDPRYDNDTVRFMVKALQNRLNQLGYDASVADGLYEAPTTNAVNRWQKAVGLPLDGTINKAEYLRLFSGNPGSATPLPKPKPAPTVQPKLRRRWPAYMGAQGAAETEYFGDIKGNNHSHGGFYANEREDIGAIQHRLQALKVAPNIPGWADGVFGPPTVEAVAKFQAKYLPHTTSPKGQVWSDEWNALFTW